MQRLVNKWFKWTTDPCAIQLTAGSTVIQLCEKVMPLSCKHWLLCLCRALDSCGRAWIAVGSDSHWNSNWSLSASSLWLSTKPSLVKIRQRWAERKGKERDIWILSGKREKQAGSDTRLYISTVVGKSQWPPLKFYSITIIIIKCFKGMFYCVSKDLVASEVLKQMEIICWSLFIVN